MGEETSALCNSLAIMVNGRMKCIGGQQYLKSKFGKGVEVELQSSRDFIERAKSQLKQDLTSLELIDQYETSVKYQARDDTPLGDIFEKLEELKNANLVSGYTVHQPTLEQIFLSLTENQRVSE